HDIEQEDPRGRTPLELAVSLGNLESVRVLLRHNANVGKESCQGWAVLQEAVSTGDPEMVQLVLQYRDYQRATQRLAGIPELLNKLRQVQQDVKGPDRHSGLSQAPDFYVEMKWEFTSWGEGLGWGRWERTSVTSVPPAVPLMSKMCPSDVYRVWKRALLATMRPSEEHVASRLTSPIVSTHLDTRNVAFERNKCGIWGWRSEKMETVSGYEAKAGEASGGSWGRRRGPGALPLLRIHPVYSATNVELVTRTRTEHLSDQDKFKATLWLSEEHPLSLGDQVMPIIDLMAISNAHFAKLRDFINLRLPPGFPVKIEIPLFHVLNARITFSNLCGCDEPLSSVWVPAPGSAIAASASPFPCEVDPAVFEVPDGYSVLGAERSEPLRDEDDDLLQFAIQQSLLEAGTEAEQVTVWEALTNTRPGAHLPQVTAYEEQLQLERTCQVHVSALPCLEDPAGRGRSRVCSPLPCLAWKGPPGEPADVHRARGSGIPSRDAPGPPEL
ncbi:hypothetical protein E2I00_010530, partial [Balaenoptera physalus]